MRAAGRLASLAVGVALTASPALALPSAPYQGSDAAYGQGAFQSLDRYGGGRRRAATQPAGPGALPYRTAPGAAAAPARYLTWSGKTAAQAPLPVQPAGTWASIPRRGDVYPAPPRTAYQRQAAPMQRRPMQAEAAPQAQPAPQTPEQTAAALGPPTGGWRPYRPQTTVQTTAQAAAPASIYDAPAPPRPVAVAAATQAPPYQGGARFYSLHRDYGMEPNAIPIPPQFFGPTADLSAPPADPAVKRVTTATGSHTQAAPTDDQGGQ